MAKFDLLSSTVTFMPNVKSMQFGSNPPIGSWDILHLSVTCYADNDGIPHQNSMVGDIMNCQPLFAAHVNPFPAIHDNWCLHFHLLMYTGGYIASKVNPDQTAPLGEVLSRGFKTFFILNSSEHEIYPAHKCKNANNCWHFNIY